MNILLFHFILYLPILTWTSDNQEIKQLIFLNFGGSFRLELHIKNYEENKCKEN